jgi:hypothetical protein
MDFLDFEIRAWQTDVEHVQVIVHSSPVGDMRAPEIVRFDPEEVDAFRRLFGDRVVGAPRPGRRQLADGGRLLAAMMLPPPVYSLLIRSQERAGPDNGLRIRLCLDGALTDLPWEFLYRPDAPDDSPLAGFMALDPALSLVRGSPRITHRVRPSRGKKRLLFAGTPFFVKGQDYWGVEEEGRLLAEELAHQEKILTFQSVRIGAPEFQTALANRVDIFHYSGHTDVAGETGYLLEDIRTDQPVGGGYEQWEHPDYRRAYGVDRLYWNPLYSETLGALLRGAGTRLAVFNACNSGRWLFVEPLIRAGLPVVIGTQGLVTNVGGTAFFNKLYSALVIGLSLEEAVSWARLHLLEPSVAGTEDAWEWGIFMVYMPTTDAVLFPRPVERDSRERQETARRQRMQTIVNVYENIGTVERLIRVEQEIGTVAAGGQVTGISSGQPANP